MVELPPLVPGARTLARDINDFDQVVGQSNGRAMRWNILAPQDLGTLGGESEGIAINRRGDVAGWFGTSTGLSQLFATMQ